MSKPPYRRAVVVGVGLIGGSVCLALRQRGLAESVIGVVRAADRAQRALDSGVVAEATADLEAACRDGDLVVVTTPVGSIAATVVAAAAVAGKGALITDAGSTKAGIVSDVGAGWPTTSQAAFVGSHPLAGDHRTGPEAARADLFEGAVTVVTPGDATSARATNGARAFWESLGSQVVEMTPERHDELLALTSHVPHVAAAAVAATTPDEALTLVATGWADTTRVASGSPQLWRDILLANRGAIADGLRKLGVELAAYADALDASDGDALERLLEEGDASAMLWEVDVLPADDRPDRAAERLVASAREAGYDGLTAATAVGYLLESEELSADASQTIARDLFVDRVVETGRVGLVDALELTAPPSRLPAGDASLVQVLPKVGVMDPTAQSAEAAIADLGFPSVKVRTLRKYWLTGVDKTDVPALGKRLLANDAIEQLVIGPLGIDHLAAGEPHDFELKHVTLSGLDDEALMRLSREGQLYLQLAEMQTIQRRFAELGREPTDIELETIAQTWSEHCSHKTLAGRIAYRDERGERRFESMLKETIFAATNELRERWEADPSREDWCVSVFRDNAGIVRFDEEDNVCFKVETHNHPSALEPYGGANTGLGGVIRDTLGTGLGAKPIASTDVFCFAPPHTPDESLPAGVLAPRRVMRGVVEGVRDYGNRMGIPTVNGAICFDDRYLGNPLVFCGNVGLIPRDKSFGEPRANDLIVTIGGRTGRDGIHGATFSSAELTSESESLSGGAVQIGNAIEEKKVADVLLQARDRGLYHAVTDCGAGGFSSAVGEMGETIGAEVWLQEAPLKYEGLSYTEIWISEAQERMVVSVPEASWEELFQLCHDEGVEATVIGRFTPTGQLRLMHHGEVVGDLPMEFLHDGRPPVVREASYTPPPAKPLETPTRDEYTDDLFRILGSLNVASKEWVIRQYDHEVLAGSVVKPLVGVASDGPGDAAVVRPKLGSDRGLIIGCGINPCYGDFDPYHMAASAIDEAIRNCVAVGADPTRIALLDNFCWGDCERAETLGSLTRAAIACHDLSLAFEAPFISGKDSLNNEFSYVDDAGVKQTIAIPSTLLISAMGQIDDVATAVTMDLKRPGSRLYLVGETKEEFGGSHFALVNGLEGGQPPSVQAESALASFKAVHHAIVEGTVLACHDLSEGGLAAALAEMAFAGALGVEADATPVHEQAVAALFSESNSRLLCEVADENREAFEQAMGDTACVALGRVTEEDRVRVDHAGVRLVDAGVAELKEAWQAPLRW